MIKIVSPLVTIVIAAHNEAQDIRATLEAVCNLLYEHKEIIVVDDASSDETCAIVREFTSRGVRLIELSENQGVASARNVGLQAAHGEIVVILNADVHLPATFANRIVRHFANGADYVVVESRIENTDALYPRYLQALHEYMYQDNSIVHWTEGYACRRAAALAVGGFPEEFPGASGEDGAFGEMMAARFQKTWDPSIVVTDVAPESLNEYWRQRIGRGRGGAYRVFLYERQPLSTGRMLRAWLGLGLQMAAVFPILTYARRLVKFTPRGWRDWLPFAWAHILDRVGWQVGYWRGFVELRRRAQV